MTGGDAANAPAPTGSPADRVSATAPIVHDATSLRLGLGLAAYAVVVFALHTVLFAGLLRDELEGVYYTQGWHWSAFTDNPPLYAWLLSALQSLIGPGKVATAALKAVLLALTGWMLYRAGRSAGAARPLAALGAVAPAATYMFGYEMVVFYTHSLLLFASVAATAWALTAILRRSEAPAHVYALLGFAIAAGLLSKYSFALLVLALLAATLTERTARRRLVRWRLCWSLPPIAAAAGGLLVIAAAAAHRRLGDLGSATAAASPREFGNPVQLFLDVAVNPFAFTLPWLALALPWIVASYRRRTSAAAQPVAAEDTDTLRRVSRILLLGLVSYALLVGAVAAVLDDLRLRPHYMLPAMVLVMLWAVLRMALAVSRPATVARLRLATVCTAVVALAVIAGETLIVRTAACERCLRLYPAAALSEAARAAGFEGGTIVSARLDDGANLRPHFPDAVVVSLARPHYVPARTADTPGGCLVLLDPTRVGGNHAALAPFFESRFEAPLPADPAPLTLSAPLRYAAEREMAIPYQLFPQGLGTCR